MKAETLAYIKQEIKRFNTLFEKVSSYWCPSHYLTMHVILQNMGAEYSDTVGYNHKEAVKKVMDGLEILEQFSKYYNSHVENWAAEEVGMIIQGNILSEDYDLDPNLYPGNEAGAFDDIDQYADEREYDMGMTEKHRKDYLGG